MKKSILLALFALMILVFHNGYAQDLTFKINGVSFKMIFVEGGTFTMNSTSEQGNSFSGELITQKARVPDFYMGEFQVTQELWYAVMSTNVRHQWFSEVIYERGWAADLKTLGTFDIGYFSAEDFINAIPFQGEENRYPMYYINYFDCVTFCQQLNLLLSEQLPGYRFTIPSEVHWEYAARGGKMSEGYRFSGSNNLDDVAWFSDNSEGFIYKVGLKNKNELGLYDMCGNVWEWCRDMHNDNNYGAPFSFTNKVQTLRGGSWDYGRWACNTSIRTLDNPESRTNNYGFRLCLEFPEEMSGQ